MWIEGAEYSAESTETEAVLAHHEEGGWGDTGENCWGGNFKSLSTKENMEAVC